MSTSDNVNLETTEDTKQEFGSSTELESKICTKTLSNTGVVMPFKTPIASIVPPPLTIDRNIWPTIDTSINLPVKKQLPTKVYNKDPFKSEIFMDRMSYQSEPIVQGKSASILQSRESFIEPKTDSAGHQTTIGTRRELHKAASDSPVAGLIARLEESDIQQRPSDATNSYPRHTHVVTHQDGPSSNLQTGIYNKELRTDPNQRHVKENTSTNKGCNRPILLFESYATPGIIRYSAPSESYDDNGTECSSNAHTPQSQRNALSDKIGSSWQTPLEQNTLDGGVKRVMYFIDGIEVPNPRLDHLDLGYMLRLIQGGQLSGQIPDPTRSSDPRRVHSCVGNGSYPFQTSIMDTGAKFDCKNPAAKYQVDPPVVGISPNYRGNPYLKANQSADIPDEENTSLWITNLPPLCSERLLLSNVKGCGKVYATVINAPDWEKGYSTSAAKLVFMYVSGAQALMMQANRGLFTVDRYVPKVVHNRIKTAAQNPGPESRVLHIEGPKRIINTKYLNKWFGDRFTYEIDQILVLSESEGERGFRRLEWRFGSYRCQASSAMTFIEKERHENLHGIVSGEKSLWGDVNVYYGVDPCA